MKAPKRHDSNRQSASTAVNGAPLLALRMAAPSERRSAVRES